MGDPATIKVAEQALLEFVQSGLRNVPGLANAGVTLESPSEVLSGAGARGRKLLSLFLYRAEMNTLSRLAERGGARINPQPLSLTLHFLVTPFAEQAGDAHLLLNATMEILDANPVVTIDSPSAEKTTLQITANPLSLEEITGLWIAMAAPYRLSTAYKAQLQ